MKWIVFILSVVLIVLVCAWRFTSRLHTPAHQSQLSSVAGQGTAAAAGGVAQAKKSETQPLYYIFKNRVAPQLGKYDDVSNSVQMDVTPETRQEWENYLRAIDVAQEQRAVRMQLIDVRVEDGDTLKLGLLLDKFKLRVETSAVGVPVGGFSIDNLKALLFSERTAGMLDCKLDTSLVLVSGVPVSFEDFGQQKLVNSVVSEVAVSTNTTYQQVGLFFDLTPIYLLGKWQVRVKWRHSEALTDDTMQQVGFTGCYLLADRPLVLFSNTRDYFRDEVTRFFFVPTGTRKLKQIRQTMLLVTPLDRVPRLVKGAL